ncbi:MAG: YccF domain-containing protein [Bacteroidales bacterium]|nr:YccF domain-containing protein [Bacteroidales bacterium]
MNLLGNLIWVLFGGILIAIEYFISGLLLCLTIIGIPFGIQTFKLALFALWPFGYTTVVTPQSDGCLSTVMNILWLLLGGIWIALSHLVLGALFCITIIGIPFGLQHFKLMTIALTPFGRTIVPNS